MNIINSLKAIENDIINWRRYLHENPELGLDLPKTSNFVKDRLDDFGIKYRSGVGTEHDIIGIIKGDNPGNNIGFRADMDALPVIEDTGLSFQSTNGNMHACAHDAHTAILLGVAKILNENRDKLNGNIILIFQPGEEISSGARPIVKSGILDEYNVKRIYGLHLGGIAGGENNGKLFLNPGPMMACLDSFKIRVIGKGSHGAYPNDSIDPITIGSSIVTGIQEIISREIPPTSPGVITIGKFHAGSTYNVIPNFAEIEGTARSVTEDQRQFISRRIGELSESIAEGFRGSVQYDYTFGAPPLVNNKEITLQAAESARKALGEDDVIITNTPVMGGEDFAEYLEVIPGTFMFFENMLQIDGKTYPHHNPKFALDESKFISAASIFMQIALDN